MRVVICWPGISGYLAACWRALAALQDVELFVLIAPAFEQYNLELLKGLDYRLLTKEENTDPLKVISLVAQHNPHAVVVGGWTQPAYPRMPFAPQLASTPFIMAIDTPLKLTIRQRLARLKIGRFLDRMSVVMVAGERTWQYARFLRVPESKIHRGTYGFDFASVAHLYAQRLRQGPWPRKFLFVGRYAPEKGLDLLIRAYSQYRESVPQPWPLDCCGFGPLEPILSGAQGVNNLGFVQPGDQPRVWLEHGALVLPSRYEPWGVVIAEAAGAGLPVLCSEACGAGLDLVRSCYNGLTFPTSDVSRLAEALKWLDEHYDQAPEMGRRSRELAAAFAADIWALRWRRAIALAINPVAPASGNV
jgi:glycosyltransferase involved in cell wall biosynthesis